MKTLAVTDLDGTLLGPGAIMSVPTRDGINQLVADGLLFTYATARSWESARRVTEGLDLRLPVTVSGGAHQVDATTGDAQRSEYLTDADLATVIDLCRRHRIPPVIYDGTPAAERMVWVSGEESAGMGRFLSDRTSDRRLSPVRSWHQLPITNAFYMTVIGDHALVKRLVEDIAEATGGSLSLIGQVDAHYPQDTYLELSSAGATKAHALDWLRASFQVDRLIAFGDNLNDLPMFAAADESYAVANAAPEVLAAADGVIASNADDALITWLHERLGVAATAARKAVGHDEW